MALDCGRPRNDNLIPSPNPSFPVNQVPSLMFVTTNVDLYGQDELIARLRGANGQS